MRPLLTGAAASIVLLGLSPWIIPSIAVAAKLSHEAARNACRSEFPQNRSGDKGNAHGEPRNKQNLHACIEAKLAGKPWQ
jgi:hypothetical protein